MTFKLTVDYIFNLLNEAAAGNPGPLTDALDPEFKWRIGSETKDGVAKTGYFVHSPTPYIGLRSLTLTDLHYQNRAGWIEQVFVPLQSKLKDGLKLIPLEVEVSRG